MLFPKKLEIFIIILFNQVKDNKFLINKCQKNNLKLNVEIVIIQDMKETHLFKKKEI